MSNLINAQFMPLSEKALETLRTTYLPLLTNLYSGQTWCDNEADLTAREENIYKRQQELLGVLENDVFTNEVMLEHERKLEELREQVSAEQKLADARRRLEEEKEKLYRTHRPTAGDDADTLFAKGTMFLSFKMLDAALECFTYYGSSSDPNAAIVADAASHFAVYQDVIGVGSGLVVTLYEPDKTPQPEVQPGDIIFAVNGIEVAYVDEYSSAKNGNEASELQILRFTDAGYERMTVHLDPDAGLLGLRSLMYQ